MFDIMSPLEAETIRVLSIGHSNLASDVFLGRLSDADVTAVADVRSAPFSRHFPHYNRDALKETLSRVGIAYVFLGEELGGRPTQPSGFTNGVADYEKMAVSEAFQRGLDRLCAGSRTHRIAMMCSERDPMDCHRCLMVGRALAERGVAVEHIVGQGETITQKEIEASLLALSGKDHWDMFATDSERLSDAYRARARKVAFAEQVPVEDLKAG